ncbi:hypothetical protein PROFUN_05125 [Planoprotostelium fungivorum]|uniref:Bulb-type lectin domain-containing protein n=1 Tax=Planoprotostelium fungivorum TaxID=1890364 RepID=A0A2P6NRR3_9EUKA|nr:hypothetical protein PROFUN_05125 [Planoprotostelium fungivorum]
MLCQSEPRAHGVLLVSFVLPVALAHMAMWHPSVFDRDQQNVNSNANSNPLENMEYDMWWWHNNLNYPPNVTFWASKNQKLGLTKNTGTVFEIPANGDFDLDLASNRAWTKWSRSGKYPVADPRAAPNPWADSEFASIAYKSNRFDIKPEDFVIFTVEHDCPARFLQNFSVPNLPACPDNLCHCAWFWIHKSIGGTDQMYMTPFQCNVTNALATAPQIDYANARAPRKCTNPADCVQGPRHPMIWKVNSQDDNMPELSHFAPTYSILFGFKNGAQRDIFTTTNPVPSTNKAIPDEVICSDATLNPKKFGYRLSSNGKSSFDPSEQLVSPSGAFRAVLLGGGNLVIYNQSISGPIWGCQCSRAGSGFKAEITNDGIFRVVNGSGIAIFQSRMSQNFGTAPYRLELTDNGVFVMYDAKGLDIWESWMWDGSDTNGFNPLAPDPSIWPTYDDLAVAASTAVIGSHPAVYGGLPIVVLRFASAGELVQNAHLPHYGFSWFDERLSAAARYRRLYTMKSELLVVILALMVATGHIAMWHPSVFDPEQEDNNANGNANPLENMDYDTWWWHGNLNYPPNAAYWTDKNQRLGLTKNAGTVFEIPANGVIDLDLATNRAFTQWGWDGKYQVEDPRASPDPWQNSFYTNVAGCAVGIAYKSNRFDIKPEDFVIFSVEHDCPARFLQNFSVPNLPACPNNLCHCAWFWIHKSAGGTDQMYMTPFQCNVTNALATAPQIDYANARAPRKCANPADCVQGPRHPMIWKVNDQDDNMPEPGGSAPTYSILFGFKNGAQRDIFTITNPVPSTNKAVPDEVIRVKLRCLTDASMSFVAHVYLSLALLFFTLHL